MIRIGSRGSQLALWQANHIADALRALGHDVSIDIIRTTGDRMQNIAFASVGAKGMFTREIEDALLAETIDLAVHSLKDLPTELGERVHPGGDSPAGGPPRRIGLGALQRIRCAAGGSGGGHQQPAPPGPVTRASA